MAKKKRTARKKRATRRLPTGKKSSATRKRSTNNKKRSATKKRSVATKRAAAKFDLSAAVEFLRSGEDKSIKHLVESFGLLRLPKGSEEAAQCTAIRDILADYAERGDPPRPMSIAVFGPPGSGKSFGVKQLAKLANGIADPSVINLSQLEEPHQLSEALLDISVSRGPKTPLVFFDEFDAALNGDVLGWLKWFLAPMQDGIFFHNGKPRQIGKAVFIFAGGTADRYQDFAVRHAEYFVNRKGPDFISRLRGFLNVEGLNKSGSEGILRRALVLQHQLGERAESLKADTGTLNIEQGVVERLLQGGHYVHGARSLEALLDMCTLTNADSFQESSLPPKALRELHVSRGPMDGRTIGLSAGQEKLSLTFSEQLAEALVSRGAVLCYGGTLSFGDTLKSVVSVARAFPHDLIDRDDKRVRNLLPYPSFQNPDHTSAMMEIPDVEDYVDSVELDTLSSSEKAVTSIPDGYFRAWTDQTDYQIEDHFAWALSLFRMRLRLVQESDVLVVVGGKGGRQETSTTSKSISMPWGRFPGVAEEVMLALAFNVPVYVLGLAGGAGEAVGNLMGLARTQSDMANWLPMPSSPEYHAFQHKLSCDSRKFEIPQVSDLPNTVNDLREYLRGRTPGTERCAANGLTLEENRELFGYSEESNVRRCIELVIRGISRLEWS